MTGHTSGGRDTHQVGVLQRMSLPVVLSIVAQQVTHQTEWLHSIHFIVSHESIGFDWVTLVLESLGPHVVACRVAGLHVCPTPTPRLSPTWPLSQKSSLCSPWRLRGKKTARVTGHCVVHLLLVKVDSGRDRDPLLSGRPACTPSRSGIAGPALEASHHVSLANYGAPALGEQHRPVAG